MKDLGHAELAAINTEHRVVDIRVNNVGFEHLLEMELICQTGKSRC